MIELTHLSSGYEKKQVLFDLSASFSPGTITSIIGPNGCGKSTLLKTILSVLPITQGRILIDGYNLSEFSSQDLAKRVSYLSQGRSVPDMTVEQLVLHGRFAHLSYPRIYRPIDRKIAAQAMEEMGILPLAGQKLSSLSGGMRQNAYIAMALAQNTDYILLDEPTTYLDIANQLQLMETLSRLAKQGKGIITVLHDLPMAMASSQQILLMKEGRILMQDRPENIYLSGITRDVFGVSIHRTETERGVIYYYEK